MSNSMGVDAILNLEQDHYGKGEYHFAINKASIIQAQTGRFGVNLHLKIMDTAVLKGDRQPLGELMFKTFYFPLEEEPETKKKFMGGLIQPLLKAIDVSSHPDYPVASAKGIDSQEFWDLTLGSEFTALADWEEKTQKAGTDDNGKAIYEGTGEFEQTIKKFKKLA